jgi:hypothetical protein
LWSVVGAVVRRGEHEGFEEVYAMGTMRMLAFMGVAVGLCAFACGGEGGGDEDPVVLCAEECVGGAVCVEGRCVGGSTTPVDERPVSMEGNPEGGQTWTLLVYMIADNDLEPFGVYDLYEMMQVGSNDRLEIIVQADRAAGRFSSDPEIPISDWTSAKRFRVERDRLVELEDVGEVNMGEAGTLASFVTWGLGQYPADRVGLILWDHGGGWSSFGGDESHGMDMLTMAELKQGLDAAFEATGTERLALLGFDACLMATYEVARLMRPYAHYLMASEEVEPGLGWEYEALSALASNPAMTPEAFGSSMLPGFKQTCDMYDQGGEITLSVLNLNKLGVLDAALDRLAGEIKDSGGEATLLRARSGALSFGKNPNPAYDRHLVDIGELVRGLAQADGGRSGARDAVLEALQGVVVDKISGPATRAASGLSIYLPSNASYYDPAYGGLRVGGEWPALVGRIAGVEVAAGDRPQFTNADHVAIVEEAQGGLVVGGQLVAGTAQSVAEVTLYAALVDEADGSALVLSDTQGVLDVEGSVAAGGWVPQVLVLTQGETRSLGYISTHEQGGYTVYMIPFGYVAAQGEEAQIAFWTQVYDPNKGEAISSGFYGLSEGGTGELKPVAGSLLYPLALAIQDGAASWTLLSEAPFDAMGSLGSEYVAIPAGSQVLLELDVTDAAGNMDYVYHTRSY